MHVNIEYFFYSNFVCSPQDPVELEDRNHVTYCVADSHGSVYPVVRAKTLIHHLDNIPPPHKVTVSHLGRVMRLLFRLPADSKPSLLSRRLNMFCRYMFPGAFIVFNLIYWAVFCL